MEENTTPKESPKAKQQPRDRKVKLLLFEPRAVNPHDPFAPIVPRETIKPRKGRTEPEQPQTPWSEPKAPTPPPAPATPVGSTAVTVGVAPPQDFSVITKENIGEYEESELVRNAPVAIPKLFEALNRQVEKDNIKAIELYLGIYGYVAKGSGISIINNVNQNNVNASANPAYFESIISKMEDSERRRTAQVIDVTPESR